MPPPLPGPADKLFTTEEIIAQPAGLLRGIMRSLCTEEATRTRVSELLSSLLQGDAHEQVQGQLQPEPSTDDTSNLMTAAPIQSEPTVVSLSDITPSRTLPPVVNVCSNCNKKFKEEDNHESLCWYHDGQLRVPYKVRRNWNEGLKGPIDTPENRRKWPEFFTWTCCGSQSNWQGCTTGFHVASEVGSSSKRKDSHDQDTDEKDTLVKRLKLGHDITAQDGIAGASGAVLVRTTAGSSTSGTATASGSRLNPTPATSSASSNNGADTKTLVEGKKICLECKEEYTEDKNWPRSCWHHDGRLALDPDAPVWEEFDFDDDLEEVDTDEMREIVPQGFVYECCEQSGLSSGCTWGRHFSAPIVSAFSRATAAGRITSSAETIRGSGGAKDKGKGKAVDTGDISTAEGDSKDAVDVHPSAPSPGKAVTATTEKTDEAAGSGMEAEAKN